MKTQPIHYIGSQSFDRSPPCPIFQYFAQFTALLSAAARDAGSLWEGRVGYSAANIPECYTRV